MKDNKETMQSLAFATGHLLGILMREELIEVLSDRGFDVDQQEKIKTSLINLSEIFYRKENE